MRDRRRQRPSGGGHLRLVHGGRPQRRRATATAQGSERLLYAATGFLTIAGLVMILSASSIMAFERFESGFFFFRRQALYAIVGVAVLALAVRTPYRLWQRYAHVLMFGAAALLLVVVVPGVGTSAHGSARWIEVGPVTVQPSELAKFAVLAYAAAVIAARPERLHDIGDVGVRLLLPVGVLGALVMLQPDLGTTLIVVGSTFLLLFAAGLPMRFVLGIASVGLAVGTGLIFAAEYRRQRLFSFLDPWGDPTETGWQLVQGLLAFGSGGWSGVGLGASRQKWLYVPNAHTDFIYAIIGEELGLIGSLVILMGFGVLLFAGIRVAIHAPDAFGRLLASGIVAWFGLQIIVNLGAVTGVLPITGVPLPFLSYGGSSLVVCMGAVGVLVNIARSGAASGAGSVRSSGRAA